MADNKPKSFHILGVGAHLDDCWLGFGGTALKALRHGHRVTFVVAVTNFRKLSYLAGRDAEVMAFLDKQSKETGVQFVYLKHDYMHLQHNPELTGELAQIVSSIKPDIVFAHDENECNQDHVALGGATRVAVRHGECFLPHNGKEIYFTGEIYHYTTGWQSYGFQPDTYVDITDTAFDVLKICSSVDELYAQGRYPTRQMSITDHSMDNKSVELTGHSRFKFAQSVVFGNGSGYAEAFRAATKIPIEHRRLAKI
jgi:LmbE family N-acetylglucosaminyl deacetylase